MFRVTVYSALTTNGQAGYRQQPSRLRWGVSPFLESLGVARVDRSEQVLGLVLQLVQVREAIPRFILPAIR